MNNRLEFEILESGGKLPPQGGFFMSDESEKAAKWDMLVKLKGERSHLAVLEEQAQALGSELRAFGDALGSSSWNLSIGAEGVEGKHTVAGGRPTCSISWRSLDSDQIRRLIEDMNRTKMEIERLERATKEIL